MEVSISKYVESYGTGSYSDPVQFLGFSLIVKKNCARLRVCVCDRPVFVGG